MQGVLKQSFKYPLVLLSFLGAFIAVFFLPFNVVLANGNPEVKLTNEVGGEADKSVPLYANISHEGGAVWKEDEEVKISWTSNAKKENIVRVVVMITDNKDRQGGSDWWGGDLIVDDSLNSPTRIKPEPSGSLFWKVKVGGRIPRGEIASKDLYIQVLIFNGRNAVMVKSEWKGTFVLTGKNTCSVDSEVLLGQGEISPKSLTWPTGQKKTLTIKPNSGWNVSSVKRQEVGGQAVAITPPPTSLELNCDTPRKYKVTASFAQADCRIDPQLVGENGTVELKPVGPINVLKGGEELELTAKAKPGFKIDSFLVRSNDQYLSLRDASGKLSYKHKLLCPVVQSKKLGYDIKFIPNVECELRTDYAPRVGGAGSIEPFDRRDKPTKIPNGYIEAVSATAGAGWKIKKFQLNGKDVSLPSGNVTEHEVGATCDVKDVERDKAQLKQTAFVEFERIPSYSITASVEGSGGTISLVGKKELAIAAKQTYSLKPDTDYLIEWVKIDGVVNPKYDGWVGSANITIEADLSDNTPNREIQVKFQPACARTSVLDTLVNLSNGKPAQINMSSFTEWVRKYEVTVRSWMSDGQCYYEEQMQGYTENDLFFEASAQMHRAITDVLKPQLSANKPVVGGFHMLVRNIERDFQGQIVNQSKGQAAHAVLITGLREKQLSLPPRTGYEIDYLDSNTLRVDTLYCESRLGGVGLGRMMICNIPLNYRILEQDNPLLEIEVRYLFVLLDPYDVDLNSRLMEMPAVRANSIEWIQKNFTKIKNFLTPESDGVCLGWTEFNARAALLIKECPWQDGAQQKSLAEPGTK